MDSFKKRQKEMQRQERQRDKAAKRLQRKQDRAAGINTSSDDVPSAPPEDQNEIEPLPANHETR
jgi:hypothetical protein